MVRKGYCTKEEFDAILKKIGDKSREKGFEFSHNFIDHEHLDVLWYNALDLIADVVYKGYDISFVVEGDSYGKITYRGDTDVFYSGLYGTKVAEKIPCDTVLGQCREKNDIEAELVPQVFVYIEKEGDNEPEEFEGFTISDNVLYFVESTLDEVLEYIDNRNYDAQIREICARYGGEYRTDIPDFLYCNTFWYDQKNIVTVKYHGFTIAYDVCGEIRGHYLDTKIRKKDGGTALWHDWTVRNLLKDDAFLRQQEENGKLVLNSRNWVNLIILDGENHPVVEPDVGTSDNILVSVLDSLVDMLSYIPYLEVPD